MHTTQSQSNDKIDDVRLVLLIDDCVDQRDLHELALEDDFTILTAARGREGLAVARRAKPDVIVLDVMMPGMDGWETCTRIKSEPETAHIPVVLLTGATDVDLRDHAIAVGAFEVLKKPCSVDRLRDVVSAAMKQ
jgi:CheY-like chemotaxis protein